MFDKYTRYAKYECKNHLKSFVGSDFWKAIANSLISYDQVLRPEGIELVTCSTFN